MARNNKPDNTLLAINDQFKDVVIFLFKLTRVLIILLVGFLTLNALGLGSFNPLIFLAIGLVGVILWFANIVAVGTITTLIGIREDVASLVKKAKK